MGDLIGIVEKQLIRKAVLEICDQAGDNGASMQLIQSAVRKTGMEISEKDAEQATYYLEDKQLLKVKNVDNKVLGIHRTIAFITAKGMDLLEGTITVEGMEV